MDVLKVAKLLDAKRSQAVGIFVSSLHLQPSDIETGYLPYFLHQFAWLKINKFLSARIIRSKKLITEKPVQII